MGVRTRTWAWQGGRGGLPSLPPRSKARARPLPRHGGHGGGSPCGQGRVSRLAPPAALHRQDYFNDAGYDGWRDYPAIFKAMIVNAFPPIDKLDNKKPELELNAQQEMMVKFLKVADQHIAMRRAQQGLPSRIGLVKLANKIKRR